MDQDLDALEDAALEFANVLRGVSGGRAVRSLRPGVQGSCCGCPVAETAGGWRPGGSGWEVGDGGAIYMGPRMGIQTSLTHVVPEPVKGFMAAFDAGMYPHLTATADTVFV